jgi:dTDP-4-dehydrorhamnose 3,5-epimerase
MTGVIFLRASIRKPSLILQVLQPLLYRTINPFPALVYCGVCIIKPAIVHKQNWFGCYSHTYGQHVTVELSDDNKLQFYIPRGFAHGFVVLSETATFFYKCDNTYDKAAEGAIVYNDPNFKIDWQIPEDSVLLSDKDKTAQTFAQYQTAPSF